MKPFTTLATAVLSPLLLLLLAAGCREPGAVRGGKAAGSLGTIERKDPRLDALIPPGAILEKLADGFEWAEGPVWIREGGFLLFSDVPRNTVYRWRPGEGVSEHLKPSGYTGSAARGGEPGSNGLLLDPEGRLVLCEHGDRRVSRLEKDGRKITIADRYQGKRLNSPNDGVFHSSGDLYFTDPPYGLLRGNDDAAKELSWNGVYRVSKSGEISLLIQDMTFPNGIALSTDEKRLYIANSDPKRPIWMAYDIRRDGGVENGRVFFDATSLARTKEGLPDGLKVDARGHLFATGPGGVLVITKDGEHLGTIQPGVPTANCGWGGDGTVLYVTADMYLARIQLSTKGKGW